MSNEKTEARFDSYCKKILRNKANNEHKARSRRQSITVPMSSLSYREMSALCRCDDYKLDEQRFAVQGETIDIQSEWLYEALRRLNREQREVLLLAFWLDLTDSEIAKLLSVPRSTVQYRRTSAIQNIRSQTEEST